MWPRFDHNREIDGRIAFELRRRKLGRFQVHVKDLPSYRFVDLWQAAEDYAKSRRDTIRIESQHDETLTAILHAKPNRWSSRRINRSSQVGWPAGPDEETYLPVDMFWLCRRAPGEEAADIILRVRYVPHQEQAVLEVASESTGEAESTITRVIERSEADSIYRKKLLLLSFEPGVKDEYGDIEKPERLRVRFKPEERIEDEDVVIDEDIRRILWRNVVDLHERRNILKAHKVPVRRGVLLYGPPGTGKTFACRYLCGRLPETTRILVTGSALFKVSAIFSLARMFQPSLVILEDVDLVFGAREVNLYSSVLGELLDQMDGLRPYEDVGFVLTTNAIDRMEAAIRDRPGRISQCIYFGPPNDELRRRYLLRYLIPHAMHRLNLDGLVALSKGATQAFLKEWVHRSVQIAAERLQSHSDELELRDEDLRGAFEEMRRFSPGTTGRIVGFHEGGG